MVPNHNASLHDAAGTDLQRSWREWIIPLQRAFIVTAGICLLIAGLAKLISCFGSVRILGIPDPLLFVSYRVLFVFVGLIEVAIALICFWRSEVILRACLLLWLAGCFLAYRVGLFLIHYNGACSCLGSLTEMIHVSPRVADGIMRCILAYMLLGSVAILLPHFVRPASRGSLRSRPATPVSGHPG
jgi:hypothetical protein